MMAGLSLSLSLSAERRQVRERGEEAPSLVMPARVYHREYKSVDEDQIGFQKYKIHGDIKKQKEARPFPFGGGQRR